MQTERTVQQVEQGGAQDIDRIVIHIPGRESREHDFALCDGQMHRSFGYWLTDDPSEVGILMKDADLAQDGHDNFLPKGAGSWQGEVGVLPPGKDLLVPGVVDIELT